MLYHNYVFVAVEGIDGSEKTAVMAEVAKPLPYVYVILYNAPTHMPLVSTLKTAQDLAKYYDYDGQSRWSSWWSSS